MTKLLATPESTLREVLYELDVRGLTLLQPSHGTKKDGALWVIVHIEERQSRRVWEGEGPHMWSALNAAFEKASAAGLRNSRLS